jgi:hypothetical protein
VGIGILTLGEEELGDQVLVHPHILPILHCSLNSGFWMKDLLLVEVWLAVLGIDYDSVDCMLLVDIVVVVDFVVHMDHFG